MSGRRAGRIDRINAGRAQEDADGRGCSGTTLVDAIGAHGGQAAGARAAAAALAPADLQALLDFLKCI